MTDIIPAPAPAAAATPTVQPPALADPSTAIEANRSRQRPFTFDGGAASYLGMCLLAMLVTVCTLGICYPWAVCMRYRWRTEHTLVHGYRLRFTGSAGDLFGQWVKWWLLCIVTLGIYSFWVVPRLTRWVVEHQEFQAAAEW